jgi:hypothetical protein
MATDAGTGSGDEYRLVIAGKGGLRCCEGKNENCDKKLEELGHCVYLLLLMSPTLA